MAEVKKVTLKRFNGTDDDTLHPTTEWEQVENKPSTFTPTAHTLNSHSDVNTGTPTEGQVLTWDADNSVWIAADSTGGGDVSKADLQNVYIYGKASVAITKGQAIQFAGTEGDHILIKPAVQSEINTNPDYVIGIAETTLAENDFGYVLVNGRLTLDTTGYTAGSILYFDSGGSTAGALTATEPTEPNAIVQLAAVSIGGNGNGEFVVRTNLITRNIHEINGLQNALDAKVDLAGDTMTGHLVMDGGITESSLKFGIDEVPFEDYGATLGLNNGGLYVYSTETIVLDSSTSNTNRNALIEAGAGVGRIRLAYSNGANSGDLILTETKLYTDVNFGVGIANPSESLDVAGNIAVSGTVDGVDIAAFKTAYDSHTHTFASITSKPTTLSGYGITDAYPSNNPSGFQTAAQVATAVSGLVASAPDALNTLNELAAALGDDPNFATTVSTNIGTKVAKAGDTMTGQLVIGNGEANPLELSRTSQVGIEFNDTSVGSRYLGVSSGVLRFGTNLNHGANDRVFTDGYHPNADTWTTARTLTIGNTGKSVNGSANVSWSLAEIGAAPSSHTHGRLYSETGTTTNYIRLNATNELELYNDAGTVVPLYLNYSGAYNSLLGPGGGVIFHDGYHPNADKWTTARTLSLTGDASGSTSWDGSGNASISVVVNNDSHNHDHSDGNFTVNGGLVVEGSISSGGLESASEYVAGGTNIILKGDGNGRSGIFFQSEKDGTNINHTSDFGFIQFHSYGRDGSSGESNELIIGVSNDSDDHLIFNAPDANGIKFRIGTSATDYQMWHSGNDGSGSGLDADLLDGYNLSGSATPNTVVLRDGNNYIYAGYINSNRGNETSAAASYIYDSGDGWMRKKTLANAQSEIVTAAAVGAHAPLESEVTWITAANANWGGRLELGGNGTGPSNTLYAKVQSTNGNLHIDGGSGKATYINYYANGNIYFNGTSYYINSSGSYYNGTAAVANSVAWSSVSGVPSLWYQSGSWLGDLASYGYTRESGLSMTGGSEFVVLSKSGQGSTLVDGHYLSYESNNGFFGSYNSQYGNLTGIQATAANTLTVKQLDGGSANLAISGAITTVNSISFPAGPAGVYGELGYSQSGEFGVSDSVYTRPVINMYSIKNWTGTLTCSGSLTLATVIEDIAGKVLAFQFSESSGTTVNAGLAIVYYYDGAAEVRVPDSEGAQAQGSRYHRRFSFGRYGTTTVAINQPYYDFESYSTGSPSNQTATSQTTTIYLQDIFVLNGRLT